MAAVATAALSALGLLGIALVELLSNDPPATRPFLFELIAVLVVAPAAATWWIRRLSLTRIEIDGVTMALSMRKFRLEVPCNAVDDIRPWVVPLPGAGISLHMRSGRKLGYGIEVADPLPLLQALASKGDVAAAAVAAEHPTIRFAAAKGARRGWASLLGKFVFFALLPTAVLFNAYQHATFGGPLGEYHAVGAAAYLRTFTSYWATTVIYLVLYAAALRVPAEAAALATAWIAPPSAKKVRRIVEIACGVAYYAGVPALVLFRFLA